VRTPRALVLVIVGTLLCVLAACGGDGPDADGSGGGAADDGTGDKKITIYSGRSEELVKPVLEKFQERTGIDVQARYGDSAQLAAQLLEEADRSPADVFLAQDAGALGVLAKNGIFAPLPQEALVKVPQTYRDENGYWLGVTGRSRVLVYNPDLVSEARLPTSVFDLTGPQWRGKVGIAPTNASFQAFVTAIRVQHGDNTAADFLADLKANGAQIRERNGQIIDDVAAGKLAAGLVNHYYVYEKAEETGASVDDLKARLHFFPDGDSGALVNVSGVGLHRRSADDPDALAFVDYLLGTEAQTYFAEQTFEYPLVSGLPAAAGLPPLTSLHTPPVKLTELDSLEATVVMIKEAGLA
jgi:iron(III) transport system substrate-binding protein